MKKKIVLMMALFALIATSAAFAQRVGDTLQAYGQTYRVESSSNGRLVPQLVPSLDGVWEVSGIIRLTVNGSTAVLNFWNNPTGNWLDAFNKGMLKNGDQFWRNIRSAGNLTWSYQGIGVNFNTSNPNVAIGTYWGDGGVMSLSADGQTLTNGQGTGQGCGNVGSFLPTRTLKMAISGVKSPNLPTFENASGNRLPTVEVSHLDGAEKYCDGAQFYLDVPQFYLDGAQIKWDVPQFYLDGSQIKWYGAQFHLDVPQFYLDVPQIKWDGAQFYLDRQKGFCAAGWFARRGAK